MTGLVKGGIASRFSDIGHGHTSKFLDHDQVHGQERCSIDEELAHSLRWPTHFGDFGPAQVDQLACRASHVDSELGISAELERIQRLQEDVTKHRFDCFDARKAVKRGPV